MKKDIIIVIGILALLIMSILEIGVDIKRNIDYELQHGTVLSKESE